MVWLRILLATCMFYAVCAAAEDSETPPPPDPVRVRLLDEVPNYAKILKDQWSTEVPRDRYDSEAGNYGLLVNNAAPRPVTLKECIALALENNTGLRIQMLNPIAATARTRFALSQFDPELYGNASKYRNTLPVSTISQFTNNSNPNAPPPAGGPDIFQGQVQWNAGARKRLLTGGILDARWSNIRSSSDPSVVNVIVPQYLTGLNLSLDQPLLRDFGWRFSQLIVDVAAIGEEQAYYDYMAGVATLVANVERAYWDYVLAIENVRVQERGLELAKELLRQNEGRFKVGALPRTSVLESEAEVARREADLVTARAFQSITRDNLRALVNAKQHDDRALIMIEPADKPTVVAADINLEQSLQTAYTKRPELIAARLNVNGRQVERKIAENRLLPRFDLLAQIGLNGLGGSDTGAGVIANPTPGGPPTVIGTANEQVLGGYSRSLALLTDGRYYEYLVGASLSIPIANAAAKAEYAQSKVNTEGARLSLQREEEDVTHEITEAVNNLKALLKSIEARRIARELAEENVRNQQARYDVGLATTKDLIDFQDRLTQAEREEILSLTAYNSQWAVLRRADGTILDAHDIVLERTDPEPPPWWARF